MERELGVSAADLDIIGHIVDEMTSGLGTDREAAIVDMRYSYIEDLCRKTVKKTGESKAQQRSYRIDSVLTHKYLATPFYSDYGQYLCHNLRSDRNLFERWFFWPHPGRHRLCGWMAYQCWASAYGSTPLSLDGILAGVGSVLSFLPPILMLFFFLSIWRIPAIWREWPL